MTKKIKQEQGRSMVEMLGVLAIIGVLSVGGIAGYKSAITKHRANETIDRLLKRAVVIAGQVGLGQQADISGFNQDDGTYTISLTPPEAGATSFELNVAAVPEEVCQKIKDAWTLPTIIPSGSCSGTNNMTFTFANDLSGGGNGETEETTGCDSCPLGICVKVGSECLDKYYYTSSKHMFGDVDPCTDGRWAKAADIAADFSCSDPGDTCQNWPFNVTVGLNEEYLEPDFLQIYSSGLIVANNDSQFALCIR